MYSDFIKSIYKSGELPNKFTIAMGELVRKARQEAGMSQADLAERIYTRQASISAIENGRMEVSASELVYLSVALGKPVMYFFPRWLSDRVHPQAATDIETELTLLLRRLSPTDRQKVLIQVRALASYTGLIKQDEETINMFSNDEPGDREALVQSLQAAGLQAGEWDSGGDIYHVIVPLIDPWSEPAAIETADPDLRLRVENFLELAEDETALYISTNSLQSDCEIGIMGANGVTGKQFASENWKPVGSLDEAVAEFNRIWSERDYWINLFLES